jgi:riboflavin kinase/FMN adenylyltransferase
VRPTFGADNARLVEVHLLDAALDLYGQPLRVAFVARLREERRFPGLEALTAQIAADAAQARTLLALPVGSTDEGAPETELQGRETAD